MQKLLHITHQFTAQCIDDFEELPFDSDTLQRHVERLVIVSAPFQTFIFDIPRIYKGEDPGAQCEMDGVIFLPLVHFSYYDILCKHAACSHSIETGTDLRSTNTYFIRRS